MGDRVKSDGKLVEKLTCIVSGLKIKINIFLVGKVLIIARQKFLGCMRRETLRLQEKLF